MAAGPKQPKSVSWAPGVKLCQIRLFLSDDAPALSSLSTTQDNLRRKASCLWPSTGMGSGDFLPSGFDGRYSLHQFEKEVSQIPLIRWQRPSILNPLEEWLVVAGEESQEVENQTHRQRGVLEAIYPRSSSIPPNPSFPPETFTFNPQCDDELTPLVPITAIEEEEDADPSCPDIDDETPVHLNVPITIPIQAAAPPIQTNLKHDSEQQQGNSAQHCQNSETIGKTSVGFIPGVEPDVAAAAATVAFTAMVKSNDEGSLVDRDLLIQILSDPKMIEKLISGSRNNQKSPAPEQLPPLSSVPAPPPLLTAQTVPLPEGEDLHITTIPNFPPPHFVANKNAGEPGKGTAVLRDANYYQNLIQRHGGKRSEFRGSNPTRPYDREKIKYGGLMANDVDNSTGLFNKRVRQLRVAKPCTFFNTPRGCKRGASCMYTHDASIEQVGGKRIRSDRDR